MYRNLIIAGVIVSLIIGTIFYNLFISEFGNTSTNLLMSAEDIIKERNKYSISALKIGDESPKLTLKNLVNGTNSIGSAHTVPRLINFWASWCEPCREEAPDLNTLSKKYQEQIEFIGVNLTQGDDMKGIEKFVSDYKVSFPILLDEHGEAAKLYRVEAVPTTYLIDKEGIVRDVTWGLLTKEELERKIIDFLDKYTK